MNIPRKYQLFIVIGIAMILMLWGVFGLIFKIEINKEIENYVSLALMGIAAFVLFSDSILKKKDNSSAQSVNGSIGEPKSDTNSESEKE